MIGWILRSVAVGVLFLVVHGAQSLLGGSLPWWGSLAAAAAGYVVMAFAAKRLFLSAVTAPFKAKGAPLRGARLVVHSVQAIAAPVRDRQPAMACAGGGTCDEEHEDDETVSCPPDWRWYSIDATVTPPGLGTGPFRCWAPGELMLVSHDADTSPKADVDDGTATVARREVWEDGGFVEDEGLSYEGEKRIRLTVACAPALTTAKIRYYFEGFGTIELPQG